MMFNYKELKLSLIAFILLFLIIDVTNSLTEVSYHETESNLQVLEGDSFSDNSLILRLVRPSQLDNCYEPKLYLRLVKSDGTVQPLDLGDDIPQNNFCKIDPLTGTSFHKHKHNNHCRKRWDNCDDDNNNNDNNNDNKNNNNDDNNSGGGKGSPKGGNNGDNNGSPNEGNNNGDNGGPNGGPNGGDNNGGNGGPNGGPNGGDNTGSNGGNGGPNGGDNGGNGGTPGTPGGAPGTPGGAPGGAPGTPGGAPGGAPGTPGGAPGGAPGTPGGAPGGAPGTPGGAPGGAPGTPGAPGGAPGTPGGAPGTPGAPGGTPGAPGGVPGAPGGVPGTTPVPLPAIPPTNSLFDNIHVYAISKEYILLTYYCNIPTSNELCGKLIDFSGATKNMTVFNNFNGLCTNPKIINSNYDDGGFLYTCYKQDTASIVWTSYSAPSIIDGTIKEKYSGEVGNITRYDLTYMFPTEGRGYAIVNGFLSNTQSTLSQWVVLANFITNDGQTKGTFVIFSQSTETSAIKSIPRCNIAYQLYGYSCILYIESTEKTFINIDFTSKGAVLNSQMFNVSQLNNNNQLYDVRNLWKGGECFVITEQLDQNVRGYVYSNDGIYNNTWNLPDTYTYTSKIFGIFPDNTVWAIATGSSIAANQWITVYSTALTTYSTVQGDTGYGSYSILSTVPERNAVIKPGLDQITIAYVMSNIEPSTGYITISQKNPNGIGNDFVRTKIPASSSPSGTTNNANNVTINGSLVTVKLEDYIFDRGNATYVVKIDDDFVEVNGQNLIGGSWQVSTEPGSGKNEPGGTRSSILLTPDGTKNYLEIKKKDDVKTYVNGLSDEISRALAIEKGRIFIPYERYQYNRNTREDQILLRVDVKDTNMPDQPSSNALRNSLDKAVLSKGTSSIPIGPYTESLDSTYGSPESPHLWQRYRYILIGVIIGLFLLILFALIARKKFQGGRNFFTIVVFPLILVDFVLDIIVLAVHGRDLKWFFICGWVFFLVPILFNIIISWFLIDYQLNHSKPTEHWWKENPRTALGFTLLSCIDLEALNVVSSRCAGYNALNARFTEKGRKRVLISILFITFIEDVPQLIIYALYQKYIVITEIIPILVLSSSCIILLFKIISFIYLMFIYKPHRTLTSTVDKIDDTNSDTASVETGGGGAPTSETTARRQAGVTELGNIGRSSETRTDDDNNDNEIKAEKAGLTKGGFLAGDIYGEKSQTSKQTTEEKIVEEDSSEEETFEEKEIKYTEEQQETGEQEETTTTTTTYITEDVSGDTTEINPNTGISSSQSEVTETVTTEDGDTTTTITKTFYE